MLRKALGLNLFLVFIVSTGCDGGDKSSPADGRGLSPDGSSVLVDSTGPSGDGATPNPTTDTGTTPTDGTNPPPPKKDTGTQPQSPYGKICTANSECAATNELCVKLASDSYPKTNPPPPKGICLKTCTNPNAPCSSSATHFYPCISASTWDLGSIQVCAIACTTSMGGSTKTYPCPTGTYCTRSFGGMMKICTPYQ